ncbi:MAG TPA: LON peptidase substrate-binding domain-containing protein, partial [Sandaracinaceae bacterium]
PYRRARCTPLPDRIPHPAAIDRLLPDVLSAASALAGIVRRRYPGFELGIDADTPPGTLADRIADRLVADVERRQALLEQPDVKVRLALLHEALLDLLAHLAPPGRAVH